MKILITGINGFVGSHLAELLLQNGEKKIFGITNDLQNITHINSIARKTKLFEMELRDFDRLKKLMKQIKPDAIYHLAGVRVGFGLEEQIMINGFGSANLLESVLYAKIDPKILVVGSSSQYGVGHEKGGYSEKAPFNPTSAYGISKCMQDLICCKYLNTTHLKIIRARAFNHIGPREPTSLVSSVIANQLVMMSKACRENNIYLKGDLHAIRDFTDVRDIVQAYFLLMRKGKRGDVYNVCSGKGISVMDLLELFKSVSGINFTVSTENSKEDKYNIQVGSPFKIRNRMKWKREIPIKKSINDLLDYWRKCLD